MAKSKLVGLLFEAWNDIDRVLDGLDSAEAIQQFDGGSSFAWTLAHVTNTVDAMINSRFTKRAAHGYIGQERFRFGGTGVADDWTAVQRGVHEVRGAARSYLQDLGDEKLDLIVPYDGSLTHLRATGLSLRYAVLRTCAHHYVHIGEIASKRDRLGHEEGVNYPRLLLLEECI